MATDPAVRSSLVPISVAAEALGLSRITVWRQVKEGVLPAVRIGRKFFVDLDELRAMAKREAAARRRDQKRRPASKGKGKASAGKVRR